MYRRSVSRKSIAGKLGQIFGKDFSGKKFAGNSAGGGGGSADLFSWYPEKIGEFIGSGIVGHSLFINGEPRRFDPKLAKHFVVIESLVMVPGFALSITHHFSSFSSNNDRQQLVQPCFNEINTHNEAIHAWIKQLNPKEDMNTIAPLMLGSLFIQIFTFPLWMCIAAASPAVVHCTLREANDILSQKYRTVGEGAPSGSIHKFPGQYDAIAAFHKKHARGTFRTDIFAAVVLFCIIYYCTS